MFKKFKTLAVLIIASITTVNSAVGLPTDITVDSSGSLNVAGIQCGMVVYDWKWKLVTQSEKNIKPTPAYPILAETFCEIQGELKMPGRKKGFMLHQWVRETAEDSVSYSMKISNKEGIFVNAAFLSFELPVSRFSDKKIKLNDGSEVKLIDLKKPRNTQKLSLKCGDKELVLSGDLKFSVADNRRFNVNTLSLRLWFTPNSEKIRKSNIKVNISVKPSILNMLNLNEAEDCKLSKDDSRKTLKGFGVSSKKSKLHHGGINFSLDKVLNFNPGDKTIIPVKNTHATPYLYLLHAATAESAPKLTITYIEGEQQEIKLKAKHDFGITLPGSQYQNASVAVANKQNYQCLYYSMIKLKQDNPIRISLSNNGKGLWQVAAMTLAEVKNPPAKASGIYYAQPGEEWIKMGKFEAAEAGTVLDFSTFTEKPAGKYGYTRINPQGHFTFEKAPNKRIRFQGANLCAKGMFLSHKESEDLADEFARLGYNAVRFHHYDNYLSDVNSDDSKEFIPEQLDKLDYLFHCFKKRGIYVTIDLYCSRKTRKAEKLGNPWGMKALTPISDTARDNWKAFVCKLLTHRNPYTDMTWAEDPALFGVTLLNEDFIYHHWKKSPEYKKLYLDGYKKYLQEHNLMTPENFASRGKLFEKYLTELHIDMVKDLTAYLRNDLKYRGLITDLNHRAFMSQNFIREHLDYVDSHQYWDHPNFKKGRGWTFPYLHNQTNALLYDLWCPRTLFASRHFGKPFMATELNFVFPNRYRAQYGPVIGAYAGLQDWDGLFRFDWTQTKETTLHQEPIARFAIAQDTLSQLAERIVNLMVVHNEVKPAPTGIAWPYGSNQLKKLSTSEKPSTIGYPIKFQQLGFYCRIGSIAENSNFSGLQKLSLKGDFIDELPADADNFLKKPVRTSETKQINWNTKSGTFQVATRKLESLTLTEGNLSGNNMTVSGAETFQVITAASMDGGKLADSEKILIFHQSDVTNNNIRFSSNAMQAVEHWGKNELLIRKAKVKVSLKLSGDNYRVQSIALNGQPKGDISSKMNGECLEFVADTSAFGGTMVYLIEKKR